MNCQAVEFGNVAEKYLLGQLSEPERVAFEEHYYLCPKCLEELQVWQAVKQTTAAVAGRRPATNLYVWAAAAAAAVLFLGLAGATRVWRRSAPPTPVVRVEAPAANDSADSLRLLARVEAPRYNAPILRGTADTAERQFREAMQNYARADYAAAAEGLKTALSSDPQAVAPRFYLGVCDLLVGQVDQAVSELRRAESAGPTLYLEEARFFLAKALIAKRDAAGASRVLESILPLAGDRQAESRKLLEQLQALQSK